MKLLFFRDFSRRWRWAFYGHGAGPNTQPLAVSGDGYRRFPAAAETARLALSLIDRPRRADLGIKIVDGTIIDIEVRP
jgi:hypothetical protein